MRHFGFVVYCIQAFLVWMNIGNPFAAGDLARDLRSMAEGDSSVLAEWAGMCLLPTLGIIAFLIELRKPEKRGWTVAWIVVGALLGVATIFWPLAV